MRLRSATAPLLVLLSSVTFSAMFSAMFSMSGCSTAETSKKEDPAAIYEDAENSIKNDNFLVAIERLRYLKSKFPYSKYAALAQLRIGDVYFLQESYGEAAVTYEAFTDLYPKHEKAPYAMFRVAKSHLKDMPENTARDLTAGREALDAYQAFLSRYPESAEAKEARQDVALIRNRLAEKELYIGDFYLKRDKNQAAKNRYEKLMAEYPGTGAAEKAKAQLKKAEEKLGKEARQ